MKKKIVFAFLIAFVAICNQTKAQDFKVPKNIILEKPADYKNYEKDIISCTNWLENSPLDKDKEKRKEANSFLMLWLTGTESVTINLNTDITSKYFDKNAEFIFIFMAGWTRFSLEHNYSSDPQKCYYEGFKSVITVYKRGIGIIKNTEMDHLVKIFDKGELANWIKEKVK